MAKRLSVSVGIKFDAINDIKKEAQGILDKLGKEVNLKINTVDITNVEKTIDKLNKKIDSMQKARVSITNASDVSNIEDIAKALSKIEDLSKYKVELMSDGQVRVVTETNNKLKETVRIMQNLTNGNSSMSIIGDLDKNKKAAYQEITNLQKTEYDLKMKLLSADGEYARVLQEQINYANQLQKIKKEDIDGTNLKDAKIYNQILSERANLEDKLAREKNKLDTSAFKKTNEELLKQNDYLDKAIAKLKVYKQSVDNRGGGKPTEQASLGSAIDNQISKLEQLKKSNELLGRAEKNRINSTVSDMRVQTNELVKYESSFSNLFKRMGMYAIGGSIIYNGIAEIKKGISDIVELNTVMRDLTKVAKATQEQLDGFTDVANRIAIEVGSSTEAIIEATTYYSKLGYAIDEASERAKKATVFSAVSDMGIEEATKSLITMQKGFGLETVEDMQRISDALNEVGNNYSSTSEDIAEGLRRSASSLREGNNSFEESIGLFVAANSAIQDSEVTGTSIKTISMRLKGMETDLGDTVEPISKLREEMLGMTDAVGKAVDIMEDDGVTFRSTYDIVSDLSSVWGLLTDSQRSWLSQQIAGQRQGNVFASLMFNMADGVDAYNTALNSSGSSMEEHARYMDSIQGKMNKFTETLKGIWVDAISSDSIKSIVDMGTSVLEVVGKMVNTFGALPTTVGIATTAIMLFNKEMYLGISKNIPLLGTLNKGVTSVSTTIENKVGGVIINAFDKWSSSVTSTTAKTAILKTGNVALSASMGAVSVAASLATAALTMGLSVAITAIIGGLTKFIDKIIVTKEELKEMNKEATNAVTEGTKSVAQVEQLLNQKKLLDTKLSDTTDTEKRTKLESELLEVQKQLAQALPESASGFSAEGDAISSSNGLIEEQIRLKKEEMELASLSFIKNNKGIAGELASLDAKKKKYEEMKLAMLQNKEYEEKYVVRDNYSGKDVEYVNKIKVTAEMLEKMNQEIQNTSLVAQQANTHIKFLVDNGYSIAEINEMGFSTKAVEEYISKTNESTKALQDNTDAKNENANAGGRSSSVEESTQSYIDAIQKIQELKANVEKLNEAQAVTPELMASLSSTYPDILKLGTGITDLATVQQFLNDEIEKTATTQADAFTAMIENDEVYYNSKVATNQALESAFAVLCSNFVTNNGQAYEKDLSNFNTLGQLKADLIANGMNPAIASFISNLITANSNGYQVDLDNTIAWAMEKNRILDQLNQSLKTIQDNMLKMSNTYREVIVDSEGNGLVGTTAGALEHYQNLANELGSVQGQIEEINKEIVSAGANFSDYLPTFDSVGLGNVGGGSGGSGGTTEKEIANLEILKSLYYELDDALEDVNNAIDINKKLQDSANDEDKIKYLQKEVDYLNQKKKILEDTKKVQQAEISNQKSILSKNGFTFDDNGNIKNMNENLAKLVSQANSLSGEAKETAIKGVKEIQSLIDAYTENTNKSIVNTDKEILDTAKAIQDALTAQTTIKIDAIKDSLNKLSSDIDKAMKKADLDKEIAGDIDAGKNSEYFITKITLQKSQIEETKKKLSELKSMTAETAEAQKALSDAINDAESSLLDQEIALQQYKEEFEKLGLEQMYAPYRDKMWQLGTQQMGKIELELEMVGDDDVEGKLSLLQDKLALQQQIVKETQDYYAQLVYTRDNVDLTADAYQELIQKMMDTEEALNGQQSALNGVNKEMENLVKGALTDYYEKLKEGELATLESKYKQELTDLEDSYFKTSIDEYKKYQEVKSNSLKEEIRMLEERLRVEGETPALLDIIKAKRLELADLENQEYDGIKSWFEVNSEMHQSNIDAIDRELEALDERNALEEEREERLQRQNDILEAQQRIENIKKNKNVREMTKNADGSWGFEYTYDKKELESANKDYQDKVEALDKWEKDLELQKYKDKLNQQKEFEQQAIDLLKKHYDEQVKLLEEKQKAEEELIENKYKDIFEEINKMEKDEAVKKYEELLDLKVEFEDSSLKITEEKQVDKLEAIEKANAEEIATLDKQYKEKSDKLSTAQAEEYKLLTEHLASVLGLTIDTNNQIFENYSTTWTNIIAMMKSMMDLGLAYMSSFHSSMVAKVASVQAEINNLIAKLAELNSVKASIASAEKEIQSASVTAMAGNVGKTVAYNTNSTATSNSYSIASVSFPNITSGDEATKALMNIDTIAKQKSRT